MAKKFLTGLTLVNLPSDPSVGSEGELYFNTSASVAKIYKEGAWSELGAGGGAAITVSTTEPASPNIGDAWYKNDTGEFYVYDGTYWVEVNGTISLTQEQIQDYVAPLFTNATNTNVIATYDDANNVINLNTSGSLISVDSITYPDYITFDTTPETIPTAPGSLFWDSGDGLPATVLNANVSIGLGQEQIALVKNATGSSIDKGKVVYISGAQGQRPTITLSDADTETTSSKTFGVTAEAIADGAEGFVTTFGVLRGVNTDGLTEGAPIWLSTTAGNFTTSIPAEPAHSVFIGYVVKAHPSSGEIFVNIQNGYELTELHGVIINGVSEDQVLRYDEALGLWKNTQENIITAKNVNESTTIDAFMPVYIDTETLGQNQILFDLANATGSVYNAKMPADAITTASVAGGAFGKLATHGIVRGADLAAYSDGELLYVAPEGGLTNIRPTGNNTIQPFARVLSSDNGTLFVLGNSFASYIENLPNLASGKAWIGNSGRPVETILDTSIVPENTNLYFTNERAQDAAAELFTSGVHTGASVEYNDSTGKLNITNTGVTSLYGTANEIEVSSNTGGITIGIPDSPIFTTPNIGVATATSINGTTIPSSASIVTSSDLTNYVTLSGTETLSNKTFTGTTYFDTLSSSTDLNIYSGNGGITFQPGNGDFVFDTQNGSYLKKYDGYSYYDIATTDQIPDTSNFVTLSGTQTITGPKSFANQVILKSGSTGYLYMYSDFVFDQITEIVATNGSDLNIGAESASSNITLSTQSSGGVYIRSYGDMISHLVATQDWVEDQSYLTSYTETDTLENVTGRGATSSNAITITNATAASSPTTGALIVTGGVGIGEDLYVNNNVYIGGDINITGSISGSLTYVNVTDLVVTDPLIYLAEGNPDDSVDIGIFAALNHGSSAYYHAGLIRDASDSGKWKLASQLDDPVNNVIDFTSATFDTLKVGALEVTDSSTTRTNLGLGTMAVETASNYLTTSSASSTYLTQSSASTTYATISSPTFTGTVSIPTLNLTNALSYSYGGTGLTTLGTAGQVLTVNAGATAIEWATPSGGGGGGLTTTTTSISTNSATAIESFAIATSRTAEALIQITQGTDYYSSKVLLIHDGTNVKITEYAILESTTGAIPVTISAAISGSDLELRATISDAATTNATAKVILIEVGV